MVKPATSTTTVHLLALLCIMKVVAITNAFRQQVRAVNTTIYNQLSTITNSYFEIASQYFLEELIEHHLNIDPKKLKASELITILDWLEIAAYLLIDNQKSSRSYMSRVRNIAGVT